MAKTMNNWKYSITGEALTERFEGCSLVSYKDVRGVWTIGYGHTGAEVGPNLIWTHDQAVAALSDDIAWAAKIVNRVVTVAINQAEFDALVDFTFNAGAGAFIKSTMLVLINQHDFIKAAAQFDLWDHAGGVAVAGLLRRRKAEDLEFLT
jgi:lysozyme